ncbi:MAG: hypothetical protein ABSF34_16390, partial [Verrucomicrobiota bacterium]
MTANQPEELRRIYGARFEKNLNYRRRVWDVLVREFFQQYVSPAATVAPLSTDRIESGARKYRASVLLSSRMTSPL